MGAESQVPPRTSRRALRPSRPKTQVFAKIHNTRASLSSRWEHEILSRRTTTGRAAASSVLSFPADWRMRRMRPALMVLAMSALAFSSPTPVEDECVTCSLDTDFLWPPNHNLVDVGLHVDVHNDPNATHTTTIQVYSDEDDVWPASARFSPDASQVCSTLRLRSERSGPGDGRVYLIIVTVEDTDTATGLSHFHFCVFTVVVPHDMSDASISSVLAQAQAAEDFWTANGTPPPGYFL